MTVAPPEPVIVPAPHLITKQSDHPLSQLLLGQVVGVQNFNDSLLLYYADGHKMLVAIEDDQLTVQEHEVKTC